MTFILITMVLSLGQPSTVSYSPPFKDSKACEYAAGMIASHVLIANDERRASGQHETSIYAICVPEGSFTRP